jgi:phosphopantetheinyl transferase
LFNRDELDKKILQKEFYQLWCCKEALIKTLNKSTKYGIKDLKICKNNNTYYAYFKNHKYYFKVGTLNKHIFAICSSKKITSINRAKINIE